MGQIKSFVSKACEFIVNHKVEVILLVLILLVGAFARLYKIDQYLTFLGDEGRDVIIVRRIFTELHPPLIGPGTSIGNMYLGPLYYYMMAIPLLLANYDPVGPAIFIALLGVITIFFVWYVSREFFPSKKMNIGSLAAAFLYAISPVVIIYSRSSWNPNIMPFFALLTVYGIWRFYIGQKYRWLIITAVAFAFVMQSHYLGLLLLPVIFVFWLLIFIKSFNRKRLLVYSFISLLIFLLLMSPLLIFDIRHDFRNFNAMKEFFTARQTTVSIRPWNAIPLIWPIFKNITTDIVAAKDVFVGGIISFVISVAFIFIYLVKRRSYDVKEVSVTLVLSVWLFFALLGLGLYKQNIYDHYFGFIFPALFLVLGGIVQYLVRKRIWGMVFVIILVLLIVYVDIQNFPLRFAPNRQLQRSQDVARLIQEKANGERFNIATLSERNNRDVYQYFLAIWGAKVVDVDPNAVKYTVTDQLFVVCEREASKCDPTHDPSAWITGFGWSKILDTYMVDGLTVYKLGHNNPNP